MNPISEFVRYTLIVNVDLLALLSNATRVIYHRIPKFVSKIAERLPVRELLREPEVCNLQVALAVQKQVLRLQVSVNDVFAVQVFQSAYDFCRVEAAGGPGKSASCPQI